MIEITINKADATVSQLETLVCGMVNMVQLHFTLSEHWAGLQKTAVFSNGQTTIDVLESEWLTEDTCVLPPEMVAVAGKKVSVGLRGQTTTENGVEILPSTLCIIGTVKPGPNAQADPGTEPSLPVWGQLQTQVAELRNTDLCYTTLEKLKASSTVSTPVLQINLHGVSGNNAELHVYKCMRKRHRGNYWWHPDNHDAEDNVGVIKAGFGTISGTVYAHGEAGVTEYPQVPDWMPNGGFLQTVFPLLPRHIKQGNTKIDLSAWLLPLLKPVGQELDWSEIGMMGIQEDGTCAPLLFRFYIVIDGRVVGTTKNTLCVGIKRSFSGSSVLGSENTLLPEALYSSIR